MKRELDRIRVGFAGDTVVQPAWMARAIQLTAELPWVEIPLILVTGRPAFAPSEPEPLRRLYDTFSAREVRRLPTPFGNPYEPVDLSEQACLTPGTIRELQRDRSAERSPEMVSAAECADFNLDVLVCANPVGLPRELLALPRFGTWGFEGATDRRRSALQAFWNVMTRNPLTRLDLYRIDPDGRICGTVVTATCRTILGSPLVTEVRNRWKSSSLVTQALTQLRLRGEMPGTDPTPPHPPEPPANRQMALLWGRHMLRLSRLRAMAELARPQWCMHYHFNEKAGAQGAEPALDFRRFRKLETPPDRIWADPFPVWRDGRHYLFFEEKLDASPYGHICVVELTAAGPAGPPRVVLSRNHHLSYPFIFEWDDTTYMMPESHDLGRLEVYRAVRFPDEWEVATVALQEALADATIAEVDGTWWMFAARQAAPLLDCDELVLYHAPTPLGPWTPHAANPVLSDVRRARPAGRLFRSGADLIRPVQDGMRGYGHSMRLMRVTKLSPSEYEEELVRELPPDWARGVYGNHTLNANAGLTTIDAVRLIWKRRHGHVVPTALVPFSLSFPGA